MALPPTPQGHSLFCHLSGATTMPNITITVDDRLYRAARIHAVNRKTTVTEIVRQYLNRIVRESGEYHFAERSEALVRYEQMRHPAIFHATETTTPHPSRAHSQNPD